MRSPRAIAAIGLGLLGWAACTEKAPPPLKAMAPAPLPTLETSPRLEDGGITVEEAMSLHRAVSAPIWGEALPKNALAVRVSADPIPAEKLRPLIESAKAVLLEPADADVYLAQASSTFELLDDAEVEVWLKHPEAPTAFRIELWDEPTFQRWMDEPKPGKIRVVQRADGFELQTNLGKLPGSDPNGPSIPTRGGKPDIAGLRRGLGLLKERFPKAEDSCVLASFGTELRRIAEALSGYYEAAGEPMFETLCVVYPRPSKK